MLTIQKLLNNKMIERYVPIQIMMTFLLANAIVFQLQLWLQTSR